VAGFKCYRPGNAIVQGPFLSLAQAYRLNKTKKGGVKNGEVLQKARIFLTVDVQRIYRQIKEEKMLKRLRQGIVILLMCMAFIGLSNTVRADQNTLIRILVKKGILTEKEAKEILTEAQKQEKVKEEAQKKRLVKEIKKDGLAIPDVLKGFKFESLAYLDYSNGTSPSPHGDSKKYNRFSLTRGYLTVKKEILPWLHSRITLDIHRDSDGDYRERIKYLYGELRPPRLGFLTDMKLEVGQGHIPWLDFEEHVNPYRCQGTMAMERAGIFNSADVGISLRGYLGGKLKNAKEKTGNHHYAGRYGSWHFGVYNGGGYHADENNKNKVMEGRLSIRPLPTVIPCLQLSYLGIYGEGNRRHDNAGYPDYWVNAGMISYENPSYIFTAQYIRTKGNAKGSWVDAAGHALQTEGYSFFGDYRLPVVIFSARRLHLFARYDHFDQDRDNDIGNDADYNMVMGGIAYDIYKGNKILLVVENTDYGDDAGKKGKVPVANNNLGDDFRIQAVLQLKY